MLLLYPSIVGEYELFHQASIQVRYGAGLPEGALSDLRDALAKIQAASDAAELVAT